MSQLQFQKEHLNMALKQVSVGLDFLYQLEITGFQQFVQQKKWERTKKVLHFPFEDEDFRNFLSSMQPCLIDLWDLIIQEKHK